MVGIEREYKLKERLQRREGQDDAELLGLESGRAVAHITD